MGLAHIRALPSAVALLRVIHCLGASSPEGSPTCCRRRTFPGAMILMPPFVSGSEEAEKRLAVRSVLSVLLSDLTALTGQGPKLARR